MPQFPRLLLDRSWTCWVLADWLVFCSIHLRSRFNVDISLAADNRPDGLRRPGVGTHAAVPSVASGSSLDLLGPCGLACLLFDPFAFSFEFHTSLSAGNQHDGLSRLRKYGTSTNTLYKVLPFCMCRQRTKFCMCLPRRPLSIIELVWIAAHGTRGTHVFILAVQYHWLVPQGSFWAVHSLSREVQDPLRNRDLVWYLQHGHTLAMPPDSDNPCRGYPLPSHMANRDRARLADHRFGAYASRPKELVAKDGCYDPA